MSFSQARANIKAGRRKEVVGRLERAKKNCGSGGRLAEEVLSVCVWRVSKAKQRRQKKVPKKK